MAFRARRPAHWMSTNARGRILRPNMAARLQLFDRILGWALARLTDGMTDNITTYCLVDWTSQSATFFAEGSPCRPPPPTVRMEIHVRGSMLSMAWLGGERSVLIEGVRCLSE